MAKHSGAWLGAGSLDGWKNNTYPDCLQRCKLGKSVAVRTNPCAFYPLLSSVTVPVCVNPQMYCLSKLCLYTVDRYLKNVPVARYNVMLELVMPLVLRDLCGIYTNYFGVGELFKRLHSQKFQSLFSDIGKIA